MGLGLKRDQLPHLQAKNWKENFSAERELTFNLEVLPIILQKETYKKLAGENENRVRIYLGMEIEKNEGKHVLCAFAVSAFLLGSGDVYVDYETPVYKLTPENQNFSNNPKTVIESIRLYRKWRAGELDSDDKTAEFRKYIYPNGYLLTKFELHEIFNIKEKQHAEISFGISKTMNLMISPVDSGTRAATGDDGEVFDDAQPCPPHCDDRSIYNS